MAHMAPECTWFVSLSFETTNKLTSSFWFLHSTCFFFWMDHLLASLILHIASGLRLGSKAFKCASLFGAAPGIRAADGSSAPLWNRTRGWSPTVFWDPRGQWCHWSQGGKGLMMTDHQDSLLRYVVKRVFAVQSERFSGVQRKPLLALETQTSDVPAEKWWAITTWQKTMGCAAAWPNFCSALWIQVDMIFPDEISTQRLSARLLNVRLRGCEIGALNTFQNFQIQIYPDHRWSSSMDTAFWQSVLFS